MATKDMTVGNPLRVLLTFSVPMMLSMVFQQLYSIVDSVVIGQFCGDEKFAAVSVSYPVTVLFVAFASGASIGASVVTSQLFGGRHFAKTRTCAYTSLISMAVIGAALTVIGMVGCDPLLSLMATGSRIMGDASAYLMVYIAGVTFMFIYNTANGIFTALGDSVTPLVLLIVSSVTNVVLDIVFVAPFLVDGGVLGAAWATFVAQGVSSLTALVLVLRRVSALTDSDERVALFDKRLFYRILRVAVPSVCQQSFVSVGQLFVQRSINSFDTVVQSGYGGAFKINMFTISCINTMGNALSSFVAQNTGASQWARIRQGRRTAMRMTLVFSVVVAVTVALSAGLLMRMFSADAEVIGVGKQFLWTVCPFYGIITVKIINDGVFRGVGSMKVFMFCTFFDLGIRVIASYVLPVFFGAAGIWWAFPLGWVSCTILSALLYRFGKWTCAEKIRRVGLS